MEKWICLDDCYCRTSYDNFKQHSDAVSNYLDGIIETNAHAVGGILGGFNGTGKINNSWFAGTVTNTGSGRQIHGGIIGYVASGAVLEVTNCLNSETITTNSTANAVWTAGIIGGAESATLEINHCLNVGTIQVPASVTKNYGPIIGGHSSLKKLTIDKSSTYATTESCAYNNDSAYGITRFTEASIYGEAAKTTMSQLDWNNIWTPVNNGTPVLTLFANEVQ